MRFLCAFILLSTLSSNAYADFHFNCNQAKSAEECISQFQSFDSLATNTAEGGHIEKASELCQVNAKNVSCTQSGFDKSWRCKVKTSVCSDLKSSMTLSYPPQHECAEANRTVVYQIRKEKTGWGGTAKTEDVKHALFCVDKIPGEKKAAANGCTISYAPPPCNKNQEITLVPDPEHKDCKKPVCTDKKSGTVIQ